MYTQRSKPPRRSYEKRWERRLSFEETRPDRGKSRVGTRPPPHSTAQQIASDTHARAQPAQATVREAGRREMVYSYSHIHGEAESWLVWFKLDEVEGSVAWRRPVFLAHFSTSGQYHTIALFSSAIGFGKSLCLRAHA